MMMTPDPSFPNPKFAAFCGRLLLRTLDSKGHWKSVILVWFWFGSSLDRLATKNEENFRTTRLVRCDDAYSVSMHWASLAFIGQC